MSDDELGPTQLGELRAALVSRREALIAELERSEDGARPVDLDEPIGRLSRMDAIAQQHMTSASRAAQEDELREIGIALAAMDSDDYGWCAMCEEPIAFKRLQARPHSRVCVGCQSKVESRGGG